MTREEQNCVSLEGWDSPLGGCSLLCKNAVSVLSDLQQNMNILYEIFLFSNIGLFCWLCYTACGLYPDQGLNLCPLPWQADSYPLYHLGSPIIFFAAEDGEALYSQQKQDWELTVAQIMSSLLPNSDLN